MTHHSNPKTRKPTHTASHTQEFREVHHQAALGGGGEDAHLIEFKESLRGSSALDSTWIAGTNPCDRKNPWLGVDCSDSGFKMVSALLIMHLGLSNDAGGINVEPLAKLEALRFLSFENNSFSGPMPDFNRLSWLKSLFLSGNQFSGEIPNDFFSNMGSLKKLELSANNFSGRIPTSLQKLDSLMEILLQQNHFWGPVPSFEQKSVQIIDLSNNNLDGEIPQSMSRFPAKAFDGNPNVCGAVINKPCKSPAAPSIGETVMESGATTKWVILVVVVAVLLVTILFKKKERNERWFTMIEKESNENVDHDHVVQVHAASIIRRTSSSSRRGGNYNVNDGVGNRSSKRGARVAAQPRKSGNDLVVMNEEKGTFGLPDLMKAAAEVLGNSGLGSAYKATMGNGMSVVVKRMRGMNKLNKDTFETEIRRLGRIRHRNILPPLAFHYRKEEKLLITEFIPKGSLLFLLHGDRGIAHAELDWPTRLKIIKGVARGMGFLHTEFSEFQLPHGNLKSSNILLSLNHDPLLTDYALFSLSANSHSLRTLQAYKTPEAVAQQQLSPKSDVYCLGIVILEIITGRFPSQYLNNQNSGTDVVKLVKEAISEGRVVQLIDPEISSAQSSLEEMERMLRIGATCTENDPQTRIEMREVIRSIEEVQV
ncbi:hypothetical protein C2S53_002067 [Perilla frutescens var. hirtella]|uniref:Protein kinase domain-containing protein n=1 Tax=Perilla frutescens var. hirtella TaxID=608512 RepID=A0AAD4P148_PERFH|nr:hypothetical protein C2S53_002067 [Perilla frutescens var. hirtella]